jgi:hypothetical protein
VYIAEYIAARVCDVCRVRRFGIMNEYAIALFRGSIISVRLRIKSLSHG